MCPNPKLPCSPQWDDSELQPTLSPRHCCRPRPTGDFEMTQPCLASVHYRPDFLPSASCPGKDSWGADNAPYDRRRCDAEPFLRLPRNPCFRAHYWDPSPEAPSEVPFTFPVSTPIVEMRKQTGERSTWKSQSHQVAQAGTSTLKLPDWLSMKFAPSSVLTS